MTRDTFIPVIFLFNLACLEGRVLNLKVGKSVTLKAVVCCITTNEEKQDVLAVLTRPRALKESSEIENVRQRKKQGTL